MVGCGGFGGCVGTGVWSRLDATSADIATQETPEEIWVSGHHVL